TLISGEDFAPTMLEIAGVIPPKEMSGVSFLKLLQGNVSFVKRKYIFTARVPHGGDGGLYPNIAASVFDLSRSVRSENFKLIYNTTPHQPVQPIDTQRAPSWLQMKAAFAGGTLESKFVRAYFTTPRPTYELYNLTTDPNELINLVGNPQFAQVLRELKEALTEKMVLDWDFLPPPLL
ncbi:MAG: sulfatase/phosphatase domain-containing protein, partial [Nitrosomonas sp.]